MNMPSDEEMQKILHSPFDIEVHKRSFIHYLEVIIKNDGTVEYAVPSHTLKLASIYGKDMDHIFEEYAHGKHGMDPIEWLCDKTGCLALWEYMYTGQPNANQIAALRMLKYHGVFEGDVP